MPSIKHILFPVDFSERSDGAAPFVAAMAAKFDARVTLLTAAHANYAGGLAGAPMIDPQTILDAVQTQLDDTYLKEFAGLNVARITVPKPLSSALMVYSPTRTGRRYSPRSLVTVVKTLPLAV